MPDQHLGYDPDTGHLVFDPTSGHLAFDCPEPTPPPWDCCHCGDCCYSTTSVSSLTWAFDDPAEYSGWFAQWQNAWNAFIKAGTHGITMTATCGNWSESWIEVDGLYFNVAVARNCSTGAWSVFIYSNDYSSDHTMAVTASSCCSASGTSISSAQFGGYTATGSWSLEITNNRCCHEDDANECHETAAENCPDDDDCDDLVLP